MKLLLTTLLALPLSAQMLPNHWIGAAFQYDPAQHPRVSGGLTMANLMSTPAHTYSFTTSDITVIHGNLISSVRTGLAFAQPLYEDKVYLVTFGTVGAATSGKNASLATSGGGMLLYRFGKHGTYTVHGGFHVLNTGALGGGPVNVPEAGVGLTF